MVGRGKSKRRLKEDRISQLPDPLICHILSHLPTKKAVETSVLSTRWRSLWLWVPCLELAWWDLPNISAFKSFGNRFFDSNRVSCLHKLKLSIDEVVVDDEAYYLTSWIDAAVKRKIQHLHVCRTRWTYFHEIPLSLYICETLVSLKLHLVGLPNAEFVSLPCLRTLKLKGIFYPNEATFERLVSSCSVLEELKISSTSWNDNAIVFRVLSRSLKKLKIRIQKIRHAYCSGVVIDAPQLSFLSIINGNLSKSFVINNMHSNAKLDISTVFGLGGFHEAKRNSVRSFLLEISKVRDMTLCRNTVKVIYQYSKLEPLPRFGYMSRLHVTLSYSYLKWLPTFLESCPNLKSLILICYGDHSKMALEGMNQISFSYVPECLLSSLEFVDFKISIRGHVAETKLARYLSRYFLENSAILKNLTLRLANHSIREKSTLKELLRMSRGSTECEVVVL